jgi:hypothetical protein
VKQKCVINNPFEFSVMALCEVVHNPHIRNERLSVAKFERPHQYALLRFCRHIGNSIAAL